MWDIEMTLEECIQKVALRLAAGNSYFGHGTGTPEDEAAWLVLHAAGLDSLLQTDSETLDLSQPVDVSSLERLEKLLDQRIEHKVPTAYLTGYTWFCELRIMVTRDVLVPRSPVAELIRRGFAPWLSPDRAIRALDLCTGSGCIAVAMACHWPAWQIDAVDISPGAVEVANTNARAHGISNRLRILQGHLFEPCKEERYDLIVANPPYVASTEYAILPAEYRAEPEMALFAGKDGLDLVYRILSQAADHLAERGILICEVGHSEATLVAQMPAAPFMWFEFEHGGQGVFMLDREQLLDLAGEIKQKLSERGDVE